MKKRLLPLLLLIVYSALLVNVMVFKYIPMIRIGPVMLQFGGTHEGAANLVPFKTILPYLSGESGFLIAFINIAGNILLLVPFGFIVPFVDTGANWKKVLLIAAGTGLVIESIQALLRVGIFDIDDVILNGLGVMIGWWLYIVSKKIRWTKGRVIAVSGAVLLMAALPFFYVFAITHNPTPPLRTSFTNDSARLAIMDTSNAIDMSNLPDPCGGTGGTGQIMSVGDNTVTIKQHNGSSRVLKITPKTILKNAAGPLLLSTLKPGQNVTVVIGLDPSDENIASAVLVCNRQDLKK